MSARTFVYSITTSSAAPLGRISAVSGHTIDIADLPGTGTPSSSTYLRGDGTWSTPTAGTGTVTSVNLTAPAAGITVSGGPVTTSGSITLALADDLAALEGLSGTNTIYYRSAASTWTAVTIGTGLSFTSGSLACTVTAGTGTVTSVSVVTANGVSGSVATATTTPAITLTLGAITPTTVNGVTFSGSGSVASSGTNSLTGFTGSGTSSGTNTGNQTITLTGDVTGSGTGSFVTTLGINTFTAADIAAADKVPFYDVSGTLNSSVTVERLSGFARYAPGGRLTGTTGTPVVDNASITSIYYTPYVSDIIPLWDGTRWLCRQFTELTYTLSGVSTGSVYDIFVYDNSGTATLEKLVWTNTTTRATAVTIQDGRYCKSGDKTRLYLGTFYGDATNTTVDTVGKRYLWNMYNRRRRPMSVNESADSWTYTTATWRAANNSSANRVQFVLGLDEDAVRAVVRGATNNVFTVAAPVGIGLDRTNVNDAQVYGNISTAGAYSHAVAEYCAQPGAGYHYLQWIEYSAALGTTTWYGDTGDPTAYRFGMTGDVYS